MKKLLVFFFALAFAVKAGQGPAPNRTLGVGLFFGSPTGITSKIWLNPTQAIDFAIGWWNRYDGWHDRYYGVEYRDRQCYDNGFYRNNENYCDDRAYYPGRYTYGERRVHLQGDFLFHNFSAVKSRYRFPVYYGPGLSVDFWEFSGTGVAARGVLGISWMPDTPPIDVFLEIAPELAFTPYFGFDLMAGFGGRWYFF